MDYDAAACGTSVAAVPAVGAGGSPQLVRRVEGLSAPQQLQVELDASQVVRSHQTGRVTR